MRCGCSGRRCGRCFAAGRKNQRQQRARWQRSSAQCGQAAQHRICHLPWGEQVQTAAASSLLSAVAVGNESRLAFVVHARCEAGEPRHLRRRRIWRCSHHQRAAIPRVRRQQRRKARGSVTAAGRARDVQHRSRRKARQRRRRGSVE